jgi:hypothetical protein
VSRSLTVNSPVRLHHIQPSTNSHRMNWHSSRNRKPLLTSHSSTLIPPNTIFIDPIPFTLLSFTLPEPPHTTQSCFIYTHTHQTLPLPNQQTTRQQTTPKQPPQSPNHTHIPHHNSSILEQQRNIYNKQFSLSIARPKLDFPSFSGGEPINWLRMCEKYFARASVPTETWVPLATLHCHGIAQTWWRSLRTPTNYNHCSSLIAHTHWNNSTTSTRVL